MLSERIRGWRYWPIVLIGLPLTASAILGQALPAPPARPKNLAQPQQTGEAKPQEKAPGSVPPWQSEAFWETLFTGVIALYAIRAFSDARISGERQLRAYVWVKAVDINDLEKGKYPSVTLEIRNAGQTPAYDQTIHAVCFPCPYPLPADTEFPAIAPGHGRASKMTLHPGAEPPFVAKAQFLRGTGEGLSQIAVDGLLKGDVGRLYAFALVKYRDAFGHDRTTHFCAEVDCTDALRGDKTYKARFAVAPLFNEAK